MRSHQITKSVDSACGLMSAKGCCIVNDKVMISVKSEKPIKVISHFDNNRGITTLTLRGQ